MSNEHASKRHLSRSEFDAFYDHALPIVHGYLLRLCGGDADDAWDLTQESWVSIVRQLNDGHAEKATVGYLLSIARSRYIDRWRRQARLQRGLRLVWAGERDADTVEPARQHVLDHVTACSPAHRTVLMLAYVDDMPVAEIARTIGRSSSSTYALLERARAELRQQIVGVEP